MTRTQLRDLPRQDLIEFARRTAETYSPSALSLTLFEMADRLEDCGRTDDYPFVAGTEE